MLTISCSQARIQKIQSQQSTGIIIILKTFFPCVGLVLAPRCQVGSGVGLGVGSEVGAGVGLDVGAVGAGLGEGVGASVSSLLDTLVEPDEPEEPEESEEPEEFLCI